MRLQRLWGVSLTLVTDGHINYTRKGENMTRFAYFDNKKFLPLFELAIKQNRPLDILIERRQNKAKTRTHDYVIQVLGVGK